jgi:hypothetical protein
MKTENKIENFFNETIGNLSNDELNTLFTHYDMYMFTDNDFNRWLCLDDDKQIQLNNDVFLFYYFVEILKFNEKKYKEIGKNELKRELNNLIKM